MVFKPLVQLKFRPIPAHSIIDKRHPLDFLNEQFLDKEGCITVGHVGLSNLGILEIGVLNFPKHG